MWPLRLVVGGIVLLFILAMTSGFASADLSPLNRSNRVATNPNFPDGLVQDAARASGRSFDEKPEFADDAVPKQLANKTSRVPERSGFGFDDESRFSDGNSSMRFGQTNFPIEFSNVRFDVSENEMRGWTQMTQLAAENFGDSGMDDKYLRNTLIFARPKGMHLFKGQSDYNKRKRKLTTVTNPEFNRVWFLQRSTTVINAATASNFQFEDNQTFGPALCTMNDQNTAVRIKVIEKFNTALIDHRDKSKFTNATFVMIEAVDAYGRVSKIRKPVPIQQLSPWHGKHWGYGTVLCKGGGEMAQVFPGWPIYVPDWLDTHFSAKVEIVSATYSFMPTFGAEIFYHLLLRTVEGQATKSNSKLIHITCLEKSKAIRSLPPRVSVDKWLPHERKCHIRRRRTSNSIILHCGGRRYGKYFTLYHYEAINLVNIHRAHEIYRQEGGTGSIKTGQALRKPNKMDELLSAKSRLYDVVLVQE
eukprot:GHVT01053519.1.p1 GENE.GHVT01053519.1~~GHVT01053519.1.p1  ORF type:complete len:474 (+),score=28.13 GHVT01053519.1:469-1890(+)